MNCHPYLYIQLVYPVYLYSFLGAIIGFRDAGGGIIANEGDAEVIIVVTSDGFNQEAVSVQYSIRSGSAQGN